MVACVCLPAGVPFMPRAKSGIGRTGNKQVKAKAKVSSQTSPQVVEAAAEAVAEAEAPAEGAERQRVAVLDESAGCDGRKLVRFERNPPRVTGIRRTLPVSGPWTWGGRDDFPSDHPRWSRNQDGTPREVDLQLTVGKMALCAHKAATFGGPLKLPPDSQLQRKRR